MVRLKIAVLGSGPAGLFAAHAIEQHWRIHDFRIFSVGKKSHLNGAQYLHKPIPELNDPLSHINVRYQLIGTADDYRRKVYGDKSVTVSPEILVGEQPAWDIRAAYNIAWAMYSPEIIPGYLTKSRVREIVSEHDLVISTVPARNICRNFQHVFPSRLVWAVGDAPELGVQCPVEVEEQTVLCNGLIDTPWYRAANVFNHRTAEWPFSVPDKDLPPKATLIRKPIRTDCDCWGDKVLRLGRFGTWTKTELAHTAFYRTGEYLDVHV